MKTDKYTEVVKRLETIYLDIKYHDPLSQINFNDEVSNYLRETIDLIKEKQYGKADEKDTKCIDCGIKTKPGSGSARCPECWEARCGA